MQPSSESLVSDHTDAVTSSSAGSRQKRSLENLDVLFAVRKSPERFYNKKSLKRKVERFRGLIESSLGLTVMNIFTGMPDLV